MAVSSLLYVMMCNVTATTTTSHVAVKSYASTTTMHEIMVQTSMGLAVVSDHDVVLLPQLIMRDSEGCCLSHNCGEPAV